MSEEEKKAIDILKDFTENEDTKYCYDWQGFDYETILGAIECLLNLIDKQQKEIKELKLITNTYDSYEGKDMDHTKIIIADSNYFVNGTFVEKYISKDKIRDILLKFQNEYGEDLETTDRLFIGKEVVQYGEDMIDEIAKELDIKLLEG